MQRNEARSNRKCESRLVKNLTTVCILDNDKQRCLRQERALDAAIAAKKLAVNGISNYGANSLARSGVERFPAIEVDGVYFTPKLECPELDFEMLCDFLDMLVRHNIVKPESIACEE